MDIRFYDFEFKLLKILPNYTASQSTVNYDIGYISCNTTTDFNGSGSFEIVFCDPELMNIVEEYKDNLLITWGDFQGILTGYQWDDGKNTLFGMHVNSLLSRRIIPLTDTKLEGNVGKLAYDLIDTYYDFLTPVENTEFTEIKEYTTEAYKSGDTVVQNILALDNAGYKITADFVNKQYAFEIIKSKENSIMLSENNLNAYQFKESYDNKARVTGGWYKYKPSEETDQVWAYYNSDAEKQGIYKIETTLSSNSEDKAKSELAEKLPFTQLTCQTRNIKYGVDYQLGDVVRCQSGSTTRRKQITSVNVWYETENGEQPILSEV